MEKEEIRVKIRELGGIDLDEEHGYFPVSPKIAKPIIHEYYEKPVPSVISSIQSVWARTRHKLRVEADYAIAEGIISRFFKKTCTKYHEPDIKFRIYPTKIRKAIIHLFSFKITGDVEVKFENNSKEGEEGKTTVWRWQSCPTSDDAYHWEKVKGSADLKPSWNHKFVEDSTSVVLGVMSASTDKVVRNSYASASANWDTGNIFDYFWSLVQLFITGTVTTRNGFDVTVNYNWLGSNVTKSMHVDAKVTLPVEAVEYRWD